MLTETPFNDDDVVQVKAGKEFEKFLLEKTYFSIALAFISAFIGIQGGVEGYLVALVILLFFFAGLPFCKLILHKHKYMLELDRKIKYSGEITILKKNHPGKKYTLLTDALLQKKIHLNDETVFDRIQIGDVLYIEISKYTETIFKLRKGKRDLFKHLDFFSEHTPTKLSEYKKFIRKS